MKALALSFVAGIAAFVMTGCGSDSNNSTAASPAPTVTLSASNVDAAASATASAAMSSASMADVNPVSTSKASAGGDLASTVKARSLQRLLFDLTQQIVIDRVMVKAAPGSSAMLRTQAVITRMETCAVSGSVSAVLDDRDGSNTVSSGDLLTVTFDQCKPTATDLINGSVSATYSVVQVGPSFASASATVTYSQLQASSTEGSFSIDGSFNYNLAQQGSVSTAQLSIGVNNLTASVTGTSGSETVTLHAGYTVTATRDPDALPPEGGSTAGLGTLTVNGAISATSIGGTIVIATPVTIKQYDVDPFPREGQVSVRGVNNGQLLLTVLSTSQVQVQLDADGDGTFELTKVVNWSALI